MKSLLIRCLALVALAVGLMAAPEAKAQVLLSSTPLVAGQHYVAGVVLVYADDANIYVSYFLDEGWTLKETHLAVESDLASIPQTGGGNVKIGHFQYGESFSNGATEATYTIARSEVGSLNFFVASHAVVERAGGGRETAWSGPNAFAGKNWATYIKVGNGVPPNR